MVFYELQVAAIILTVLLATHKLEENNGLNRQLNNFNVKVPF